MEVWHTQTRGSQLECPICYSAYDNMFKTPKLLSCAHTFCLECLSRLLAISPADNQATAPSDAGADVFCPLCRQSTTLSEGGPPSLPTDQDTLHQLPHHQQREEPVWLDGDKLCYKSCGPTSDSVAPSALCVCIDIGATAAKAGVSAPARSSPRRTGPLGRLSDWRRMALFVALMVLLVLVVLWPLQCAFSTGNLRCSDAMAPNRTVATPTTLAAFSPLTRPPATTQ
ncbi:RING finger protein 223 [Nerophis lumbriciformis]|uniref:RING finger protein 223 n=1 Tax=Nerophis lumbriciformis TaxID=546530 RepID=UPI002ADFC6E4|nr:RING finger protein 223-like [Nerophis lumbriciformis]